MKRLSESEVKKILEAHELWLKTDRQEGECADFPIADLSGMDFHGRDLRYANFYGVGLANADFHDADLRDVCFNVANLTNVNFYNARLSNAVLLGANLTNADFRGADLTVADLNDVDAFGMIYDETTLPAMVCPKKGSFVGYKKVFGPFMPDGYGDEYIVELRIPEGAKRNSATDNQCRCSKAEVLSITRFDGTETDVTEVYSNYDPDFVYRLGETVEVPDFDECRWHECTKGIHFFMNREDAVGYYC